MVSYVLKGLEGPLVERRYLPEYLTSYMLYRRLSKTAKQKESGFILTGQNLSRT